MMTAGRTRLPRMWQLYLMLLASVVVFACGVPMLSMQILGVKLPQYALFLCVSASSALVANLLVFIVIRRGARSMLNGIVEQTRRYVDLPDEYRNAKPSMEVDAMENVFGRVLFELHGSIRERLRAEREGMLATIASLVAALESRDRYTQNHSARVAALSGKIAVRMGMSSSEVEDVKVAALLHDIGKIGIRDAVLLKTGRLTRREYDIIMTHPRIAGEILKPIKGLDTVIDLIVHHHERPDGKGYPDGLGASEVPIGSFIIATADSYDAMTIDRPYRPALPPEKVITELVLAAGTQLHHDCVDALILSMIEEERLGLPIELAGCNRTTSDREREQAPADSLNGSYGNGAMREVSIDDIIRLTWMLDETVGTDPLAPTAAGEEDDLMVWE